MEKTSNRKVKDAARECNVSGGTTDLFNRRFTCAFGFSIACVVRTWNFLVHERTLPDGNPQVIYLLWALSYLKSYLPENNYRLMYNTTEKTFRKWVLLFIGAIAELPIVSTMYLGILYLYKIIYSFI
jgi:hypothetical protein